MRRLLILSALLATASSCDSGPDSTGLDGLSQDASLLVGTWEWERSYSCGDGSGGCQEFVPARDITETLTFAADGTVVGFFNGGLMTEARPYRVQQGHIVLDEDVNSTSLFGVSQRRLVITTAARDGEETTYRRR